MGRRAGAAAALRVLSSSKLFCESCFFGTTCMPTWCKGGWCVEVVPALQEFAGHFTNAERDICPYCRSTCPPHVQLGAAQMMHAAQRAWAVPSPWPHYRMQRCLILMQAQEGCMLLEAPAELHLALVHSMSQGMPCQGRRLCCACLHLAWVGRLVPVLVHVLRIRLPRTRACHPCWVAGQGVI